MRGRSYHKLRETTFDLYNEQERLPWYFKFLSILSAWLVLAGFILFNIAYAAAPGELRISPNFVTGLAATGVFLGYLSDAALAFLSRSLIFVFDGVLMPVLTASAVGVFSTIIHRVLKREIEPGNAVYLILPLAVAGVGTVASATLSFIVYRKLRKIKDLDARRRVHIPLDQYDSPMLPSNVPRAVRDMVPDDEKQRQQLMALLMHRHENRGRDPSMDGAASTYRIDLPWESGQNRQRSGSVPSQGSANKSSRLTIGNIVGRDRSGTAESFKDPRERRREEIERSGLTDRGNGSAPSTGGLSPAWPAQRYSPPI